jgi:hypothetical protein
LVVSDSEEPGGSILGAVPASQVQTYLTGARIIDVVCEECGERLGAVERVARRDWLVTWAPHLTVRRDNSGEPLWSIHTRPIPPADEVVTFHCFNDGHCQASGREVKGAVSRHRGKRPVRLVLTPHP